MKQAILSLILALLLFGGCKAKEVIRSVDRDFVVNRDSIVTKIIKDTFFVYPPQDNKVVTKDSSFLKTDLAFSFAKIQPDGLLFHSIENFGKVPEKVVEEKTKVNNDKKTTITINTTTTITKHKWNPLSYIGLFSMIAGLIWVIFKIKKLFSI